MCPACLRHWPHVLVVLHCDTTIIAAALPRWDTFIQFVT